MSEKVTGETVINPDPAEQKYIELGLGDMTARIKAGEYEPGTVLIDHTPDSSVFKVNVQENLGILRISTPTDKREDDRTSLEGFMRRVKALKQGSGMPVYEQLVAYSVRDEAVVTVHAAGEPLQALSPSTTRNIRVDQLEQVGAAINQGVERGILIDASVDNFFYDQTKGFTIIDYTLAESDEAHFLSGAQQYAWFLQMLVDHTSFSSLFEKYMKNEESLNENRFARIALENYKKNEKSLRENRSARIEVFEKGVEVMRRTFGVEPYQAFPFLEKTHQSIT